MADGADSAGGERRLTSVDAALAQVLAMVETVAETELLALERAAGRALAETVTAGLDLPPFDCSVMDGYALRSADLTGDGPWRLTVVGRVAAGDDAAALAGAPPGSAARILTGAPIPPGFDTVVMQERARREGDTLILEEPVKAGLNIRRAGEDAQAGAELLTQGAALDPRALAAIAAVGRPTLRAFRRLRVAFFCTGDELRQPGEALGPGQIYNSNRFGLIAALAQPWIEPLDLGAVPDDPAMLQATLAGAAETADMIVSTGGVAGGDEDHMPRCFRALGGRLELIHAAMKPGKPLPVGRLGDAVFIGLPGAPAGAMILWTVFGAAMARRAAGFTKVTAPVWSARADFEATRRPGRQEYRPARITGAGDDGMALAAPLDARFMSRIAGLARADGLLVIPESADRVRRGDLLGFLPLG